MSNQEPNDFRRAIHEAGHAVAAYLMFQGPLPLVPSEHPMFNSITIKAESATGGHCEISDLFLVHNQDSADLLWLVAVIVVLRAGRRADSLVSPFEELPEVHYEGDEQQIKNVFRENSPFSGEREAVLAAAKRLLNTRFCHCQSGDLVVKVLNDLAKELVEKKTLSWNDCEKTMCKSFGFIRQ